ncbi:hypothetical protein L6452_14052 [Arctium lappa]|uniref:Uncharacterized protein n=1 Tax=Arctium lappa TaxID=4217 RepID=A0ACB9CJZ6_ARCLA|nr:hypothetical protein L6452_14052 [Arctium lappa]
MPGIDCNFNMFGLFRGIEYPCKYLALSFHLQGMSLVLKNNEREATHNHCSHFLLEGKISRRNKYKNSRIPVGGRRWEFGGSLSRRRQGRGEGSASEVAEETTEDRGGRRVGFRWGKAPEMRGERAPERSREGESAGDERGESAGEEP